MKKAFTLVELLVVVVVISILMAVTFRLSSVSGDTTRRNTTVTRMNKIENCLSGYYAAFGSYPPVKVHGSRNIYARVNAHGIQSDSGEENRSIWGWTAIGQKEEVEAWEQVRAACKAQPVDCRFPFPGESEYNIMVKTVAEAIQSRAESSGVSDGRKAVLSAGFDNGVTDNIGRHDNTQVEWQQLQLFKFGLMSYLLPRYMVMMNSREELFNGSYAQWESNNNLPCNPMTGRIFNNGWKGLRDKSRSKTSGEIAEVANIPSQAVTARWMPNLEGIVCCNHSYRLFGIEIRGDEGASELRPENMDIEIYSPGGPSGSGTANQYILDSVTVLDGWWHEFYYYSAPPYQSYTLWSGGPNNRTFPPWISRQTLENQAKPCVSLWVEDDIVRMSN